MYLKNKTKAVAVANCGGAVEADTISNGRSLKSQMSKRKILRNLCVVLLAAGIISISINACSDVSDRGDTSAFSSNNKLIGVWEERDEDLVGGESGSFIFFDNGTFCLGNKVYTPIAGNYSIYDDNLLLTYNNSRYNYNQGQKLYNFKIDGDMLTLSWTTSYGQNRSVTIKKVR